MLPSAPRRGVGVVVASVLLALAPRTTSAAAGDLDLSGFRHALDSRGFITVDATAALPRAELALGLVTSWAHAPISLHAARGGLDAGYADGERAFAIQDVVSPTLHVAVGLGAGVEIGGWLPARIVSGDGGPDWLGGAGPNDDESHATVAQGLGDAGLALKLRLHAAGRAHPGFALLALGTVPLHDRGTLLGEPGPTAEAALLAELPLGALRFGARVGARVRLGDRAALDDPMDSVPGTMPGTGGLVVAPRVELPAALAASLALSARVELDAELFGAVPLGGEGWRPAEGLAALKVRLARSSTLLIGAGAALPGAAAPSAALRGVIGILLEPTSRDRDGDGIPDEDDRCPTEPEDVDGIEDRDGCPEPDGEPPPDPVRADRDDDTIFDDVDRCPDDPEDPDGVRDDDGCPDLDDDDDTIVDTADLCLKAKEDLDGIDDDDGCPEPDKVRRTKGGTIDVLENIYFATDSAEILPVSFAILDAIASALAAWDDLELVEVGGHADERGSAAHNDALTQARAEAVRDALITRGIDAARLQAVGYGERRPKVPGTGEAVWSQNRRVEFVIKRLRGAP